VADRRSHQEAFYPRQSAPGSEHSTG